MVFLMAFVSVAKADTLVDLLKKACDGGDVGGCFSLGHSYENGQGVRQNTQKALELYGKSCDMRDQDSCDAYAELKKKGR